MTRPVTLSRRGENDLRKAPPAERDAIVQGLRGLASENANADIRALAGHPRWFHLRVGDWRVLYFSDGAGIVVERVVNRRDLERAVRTLP